MWWTISERKSIMMMNHKKRLSLLLVMIFVAGCSSNDPESASNVAENETSAAGSVAQPPDQTEPAGDAAIEVPSPVRRGPIVLGGAPAGEESSAPSDSSKPDAPPTADVSRESIFEAVKPLQILMGSWEGKTQKQFGEFSAVDEPEWVWDFLTNKNQPALVMSSDKSPYFKKLRLTYDPQTQKYLLTSEHEDYGKREFEGEFIQEILDVPGDDKKLHRTYKLEFTQVAPEEDVEKWQIVFNQKDNNRYLMEMAKRRGTAPRFTRFDTVASQRQGTSFALSDTDYGEKTCIVSGGLGTMTVSFEGKTYYVCCSGCSAAFNEEPERWIAKALEEATKKP